MTPEGPHPQNDVYKHTCFFGFVLWLFLKYFSFFTFLLFWKHTWKHMFLFFENTLWKHTLMTIFLKTHFENPLVWRLFWKHIVVSLLWQFTLKTHFFNVFVENYIFLLNIRQILRKFRKNWPPISLGWPLTSTIVTGMPPLW